MNETIISIALAVVVTVGFVALIFWRIRKDDAPPHNGGTTAPIATPSVPDPDAERRATAKRRAVLTAGVAATVQRVHTPGPQPRIVIPIRRPRNKKVLRRIRKAEREARRRMYELRRLAA